MMTLALALALGLAGPEPGMAWPEGAALVERQGEAQAHEVAAQVHQAEAQARQAEAQLRQADGQYLLWQARSQRYAQRWYEAAETYRRFLAEHPGSGRAAEARFWLAASLESDQRWDDAAEAYTAFLNAHPDQRLLGREARLNRIRCWGIRQGQAKGATQGLLAALGDGTLEVQVAAALQLAKTSDRRAVETLKRGLALPSEGPACSMALIAMGEMPEKRAQTTAATQARFLVIRVREAGKAETVTIRLALALAQAVTNYLSDAQLRQAQSKGIDLRTLSEQAATLPKGSVLVSVDDGKSAVTVTVE